MILQHLGDATDVLWLEAVKHKLVRKGFQNVIPVQGTFIKEFVLVGDFCARAISCHIDILQNCLKLLFNCCYWDIVFFLVLSSYCYGGFELVADILKRLQVLLHLIV